jgi:hypothetical protein
VSVRLITPTAEPIPAGGVAILDPLRAPMGAHSVDIEADVSVVSGTILATFNAWGNGIDISAHLTPENARRLAADLFVAAVTAEKERAS